MPTNDAHENYIRYFKGIRYPASPRQVKDVAQSNGASQDVLSQLDQVQGDITLRGFSDIMTALGVEGYVPVAEERRRAEHDGGDVYDATDASHSREIRSAAASSHAGSETS